MVGNQIFRFVSFAFAHGKHTSDTRSRIKLVFACWTNTDYGFMHSLLVGAIGAS